MPILDITTLSLVSALLDVVVLLVLLHTWFKGKTYPGFGYWVLATVCWVVGSLLTLVFRPLFHPVVPVVIGNGLILAHGALIWEGFARFYALPRRWWRGALSWIVVVSGIALQGYFLFVEDNITARTINISLLVGFLFGRVAVEPLLWGRTTCRSLQWMLSASLTPLVLIFLLRGGWYVAGSMTGSDGVAWLHDPYFSAALMSGLLAEVALAYVYLALNSARIEQELRERKELFKRLAEDSADVVWQLDSELKIVYVNAACRTLFGFTPEELHGRSLYSFFTDSDSRQVKQTNEKRLEQERLGHQTGSIRYELQFYCKDGRLVWCEAHSNPLRDAANQLCGYIAIIRDISERKAQQEQLAEALRAGREVQAEQEQFLAMISHECRTPLAIMQTTVDILQRKEERCPTGLVAYFAKMQRAVERMLDVFEATRRRKGVAQRLQNPVPEQVLIEDCFRDLVRTATDLWGERFQAENRVLPELVVQIDRHLLRIALLNLLDNAVKYAPPDDFVQLLFQQSHHALEVVVGNRSSQPLVADTGLLLGKYCRGSNSSGISGTGVGLYLVDCVVRQCGGTLQFQVDKESWVTVTLTLPLGVASESVHVP